MTNTAAGAQQPTGSVPSGSVRAIWIAMTVIIGVIVGSAAGLLTFVTGAGIATAVLAGGGAFAGTVVVSLALLNFAYGKSA
jgi:hypothetical protein